MYRGNVHNIFEKSRVVDLKENPDKFDTFETKDMRKAQSQSP